MDVRCNKLVLVGGACLIGSRTVDHLIKEVAKEDLIYDTLVRSCIACPKRAGAEIGLNATHDLREDLQRLIVWRSAHKAETAAHRQVEGLSANACPPE